MSKMTQPVFIIGTGRCGTRTMFKMLSGVEDLEIYHEYLCTHVQKLACLYYMGRASREEAVQELAKVHGSAIYYSGAGIWVDSSNKLSWLIEPLLFMFPDARFLSLVRDGRKVAASFFYKLSPEIYDDISTRILKEWLIDPSKPEPPPEKKYWWNIPMHSGSPDQEFLIYDQFQRICWHWQECNRVIQEAFTKFVPAGQQLTVKLEELTTEEKTLRAVLEFIGLPYDPKYKEYLKTPQNVFFPMDFQLTGEQQAQFEEICTPMMKRLGYHGRESYVVKY